MFANVDIAATLSESVHLFPSNFWSGILGSVIYALLALSLFPIFWQVLDWVTPGNLNAQILGSTKDKNGVVTAHTPDGKPNIALAIVVGFLGLGLCIILASAIH